ncbi:Site-specific DNA recombinase [Eubacterium ruminantium]|nr:Site-specific DNA recombinase [Eubacterium ruminantium]
MDNRTYYYARVSSSSQKIDRQVDKFKEMGAEDRDIIVDKESGKDLQRTGYLALRNTLLRNGDSLVVSSLDRLSRNKKDISDELRYFRDHNITVKILDIPTTLIELPDEQAWVNDMVTNILTEVLASFAEHERDTIRRRQAEGIEAARKRGTKFGRPRLKVPELYEQVMFRVDNGEIRPVDAMKILNLPKSSYYKLRKRIHNLGV